MQRLVVILFTGLALSGAVSAAEAPTNVPEEDLPPFSIDVEAGGWFESVDGNDARAGLYVRPTTHPWLSIHDLDLRLPSEFDLLDVYARRLFGENDDGFVAFWTPGLPTMLRWSWQHATFFPEPLAAPAVSGSRSGTSYELRMYPLPGLTFGLAYQNQGVLLPGLLRTAFIDYDLEDLRADVNFPLGPGDLAFDFGALNYRDRFPGRPSSTTHQYGLKYSVAPGSRWFFSADARWAAISQPGLPDSDLFVLGFAGRYVPARNLRLDGRLRFRDINLGPTANAFVAQSLTGGATVSYRPWTPLTLRLGVDRSAIDRLDAAQAAVDTMGETRVNARAEYRGPSSLRASATYKYRRLDSQSPSAAPAIGDPSPLLADTEQQLSLRASGMVGAGGLAYGLWQWREREWSTRSILHQTQQLGVGVSYPLSPRLSVSGDLLYSVVGSNQPALSGSDADSFVAHFGFAWQPSDQWRMNADYHRVEGYYGENTGQDFFSFGCEVDLGSDFGLSFGYRREDYTNAAFPVLRFDTDVLDVSLRAKL